MLREISLLLAGLVTVKGLGQQQCFYFPDSHATDNSANSNQAVFDARQPNNDFLLVSSDQGLNPEHHSVPILTSSKDNIAVHLAVANFVTDLEKVTGQRLTVYNDTIPKHSERAVIVGTSGSDVIRDLKGYQGVIDDLEGKWESFDVRNLWDPRDDLREAIVIAGSDRVSHIHTYRPGPAS